MSTFQRYTESKPSRDDAGVPQGWLWMLMTDSHDGDLAPNLTSQEGSENVHQWPPSRPRGLEMIRREEWEAGLEAATAATGASTKYWVKTEATGVSSVMLFLHCHSGVLSVDNREHLRLFDLTWGGYITKCEKSERLWEGSSRPVWRCYSSTVTGWRLNLLYDRGHTHVCYMILPVVLKASLAFKLQKKLTKKTLLWNIKINIT